MSLNGSQLTKKSSGFTLIELLSVLAIIALLLTIASPRFIRSMDAGAEKVRSQNLATLRDAIDKYHADRNTLPKTLDDLVTSGYLKRIPLDPVTQSTDWKTVEGGSADAGGTGIGDVEPPATAASADKRAPTEPSQNAAP